MSAKLIRLIEHLFVLLSAAHSAFIIRSLSGKGMVLDIADQEHCSDVRIILCPELNRTSQMWELLNDSMLQNVYNGHFLDIREPITDGQEVTLWPPHGKDSQVWILRPDRTILNWMKLYLQAESANQFARVFVSKLSSGADTQKWQFVEVNVKP